MVPMGLRKEPLVSSYCKPTRSSTSSGSVGPGVRHGWTYSTEAAIRPHMGIMS